MTTNEMFWNEFGKLCKKTGLVIDPFFMDAKEERPRLVQSPKYQFNFLVDFSVILYPENGRGVCCYSLKYCLYYPFKTRNWLEENAERLLSLALASSLRRPTRRYYLFDTKKSLSQVEEPGAPLIRGCAIRAVRGINAFMEKRLEMEKSGEWQKRRAQILSLVNF
jgi:hypothetical protein